MSATYLVIHLFLDLQWECAVRAWAQHVGPNADGKVVGVHPAGLCVLANVMEHSEHGLEQETIWPGQLVSHPK